MGVSICLKLNLDSIKDFSCKNDETHAKSRNYWQVRHALWCLAEEDREEDGSVAARDLYLSLLWKGCPQTTSSRHLSQFAAPSDVSGKFVNKHRRVADHRRGAYLLMFIFRLPLDFLALLSKILKRDG